MDLDFMAEWHWRQIVQDVTKEELLQEHLRTGSRSIYAGFDPTADSLHVGSLLPLLALRRLQLAGHKPIALVGGGTGLIGDPSGKTGERALNDSETVAKWSQSLKTQMSRFIDFECGELSAVIVNNYDWLHQIDVITFLRDVGKYFPVGAMLGKESVRSRLEREGEGLSYTEFSYMLLQSYDYLCLNRKYKCSVQIGGSDQWGNITAGIDLIRRLSGNSVFGITLPLVTKSDGSKFGKTESGTIWLDAAKTSPYEMYQFWLNASDQDSIRFSRYFTFLSQEEIAELERATLDSPGRREAQRTLAQEVTRIVHGASALAEAEYITNAFFNNTIHDLTDHLLKQAFLNAPRLHLEHDQTSVDLIDLLVGADMAPSKGRARRLIQDGAVQINGNKITDINASFSRNDALFQRYLIIRKGKKHYYLASWD